MLISALSNGKNVRWDLIPSLASVNSHGPQCVDGVSLVRVDSDTEKTRVCLQVNEERIIKNISLSSYHIPYL